jgi:hypothetical protein
MNSVKSFGNFFLEQWRVKPFQIILTIVFVVWTLLLIQTTLNIQHSDHPMISIQQQKEDLIITTGVDSDLRDNLIAISDSNSISPQVNPKKIVTDSVYQSDSNLVNKPYPNSNNSSSNLAKKSVPIVGAVIVGGVLAAFGFPLFLTAGLGITAYMVADKLVNHSN